MPKRIADIKKVKPVVLGFDISTSVIGITALEVETGKCVFIEPFILDTYEDADLIDKLEIFEEKFKTLLEKHEVEVRDVAFEDFAQKFSKGKSSIKTILTLARFNSLIELSVWKTFKIKPKRLNVLRIRNLSNIVVDKKIGDTKPQILNQVVERLKKEDYAPWIYDYPTRGKNKGKATFNKCNFDMADSWVVARATWLAYRGDA